MRHKLRIYSSEHVIFYGYRWLAWALAGVLLSFEPAERQQSLIWLWILAGVLNIVATMLAQSYVRVARRRPLLLALDLLIGIAFIWMSRSNLPALTPNTVSPFMPYALSALVLPGLLFRWRGALSAGLGFMALDYLALLSSNLSWANEGFAVTLVRTLGPLLVAGIWAGVAQLNVLMVDRALPPVDSPAQAPFNNREQLPHDLGPRRVQRFTEAGLPTERSREQFPSDSPITARMTAIRAPEPGTQEMRHVLYGLTSSVDIDLATMLNQLAMSFGRQSGVETNVITIGPVQNLTPAQHATLLKLAQEALLNVQQHAHAHTTQLTLRYDPHTITLIVQDDGVGLLDGTHERPGVHSLRAMHYRLAELDGQLEVFEGENGGVVVRGTLPLDEH